MSTEEVEGSMDAECDNVGEEVEQVYVKKRRISSPTEGHNMNLRNNQDSLKDKTENEPQYPQYPVRTSFKTFNPEVLEQIARLEAVFRIPARVSREVLVDIANNIFHQNWVVPPEDSKEDGAEEESKEDGRRNEEEENRVEKSKAMRSIGSSLCQQDTQLEIILRTLPF